MKLVLGESGVRALTGAGVVGGIVGALMLGHWAWWTLLLVLAYLGGQEALHLFGKAWPEGNALGRHVASRCAVVLPLLALATMGMRGGVFNAAVPLGWFVLMWTNDTAAYIVGRQWGRRRIAPSISPGKSWEGWAGGALMTLLAAYLLASSPLGVAGLKAGHWLGLGVLVSVFGPIGDLLESALKRKAGVKDSGDLLPGHGGVLDRFDSHFISAPVAAILLQLF